VTAAVEVHRLVKRYGAVTAVDGLDLTVEPGALFGLLGPNGAGKTTTMETMVGLRRPTSGTIRVFGHDPTAERAVVHRIVAVQPQKAALFAHLTVEETLRLWATLYDRPTGTADVLDAVGLGDSRRTLVRRLSGGQERRLLVATALVARPRLLVLDEPSLGLDPNARVALWDAVRAYRREGGTVVLSTNAMDEAETLCDQIVIIDGGRIVVRGTPAELIDRHAPRLPGHGSGRRPGLDEVFRSVTGTAFADRHNQSEVP
jgi:ABC-2 type transport system ATP-binding protein